MAQDVASAMLLVSMFILFWIILFGLIIGGLVFWILMIVDVANRRFVKHDDKTVWILVVVLVGIIGAVIYYFMVKRKDRH